MKPAVVGDNLVNFPVLVRLDDTNVTYDDFDDQKMCLIDNDHSTQLADDI